MRQGEKGGKFFIIKEGICNVEVQDRNGIKVVATLIKGDYCGEQALIFEHSKRNATIRAKFHTRCLTLDRNQLMEIVQENKINFERSSAKRVALHENLEDVVIDRSSITQKSFDKISWLRSCVGENILFKNYSEQQKATLVEHMTFMKVNKYQLLTKQGDDGNEFFVIEEGLFAVFINDKKVAMLKRGNCFGELALVYNIPRNATVKAVQSGKVWFLHRSTFRKILTEQNRSASTQNIKVLSKTPILDVLLNSEIQLLDRALVNRNFEKGHVVFHQGDEGDKFYIIIAGELVGVEEFQDKRREFRMQTGDFFGERALLKNKPRTATITCTTTVSVVELSREDFTVILGPLEDIMAKHMEGYERQIISPQTNNLPEDKSTIYPDLKDLKKISNGVLGRGAFGVVTFVIDEGNQTGYALKAISKIKVVRSKQITQMLNEKKVMERLNSPFIVSLRTTYKDDRRIYFLLDACLGGDLFSIQRNVGSFDEATSRFYAASVIEGLVHIHKHKIAYRDLKPENLVIDRKGYLRITDFGLSKFLDGITFTFCGTPDYVAPEVVTGKGHGFAVDWWSFGVLIFELIASHAPFYDHDMHEVFKNIIQCNLRFPKVFSPECKDLICRLLQIRPTNRLGVIKGGPKTVRLQPWFKDFDWELLRSMEMEAPMCPNLRSFDDLSCFAAVRQENDEVEDKESVAIGVDMSWADIF